MRSSNNQVICSIARRSIRQTERGKRQSWKLPYASSLNCKRYLKKKKTFKSDKKTTHKLGCLETAYMRASIWTNVDWI